MSKSLNNLLPDHHFLEHHSICVNSRIEDVFIYVARMDLSDSLVARILMYLWRSFVRIFVRDLPSKNLSVNDFIQLTFTPPYEISRGLIGGRVKPLDHKKINNKIFKDFKQDGCIKLVWAFWLTSMGQNKTIVHTETRVFCTDRITYFKFFIYWIIIRPWSGLIRIRLLKSIKKKSEKIIVQ